MGTTTLRRTTVTTIVFLCLTLPLGAPSHAQAKRDQAPNGISVGRPKVFDNRTLTIMLESLSESLRNVQSQFIDQKALAAAFSFLQGSRSSDVARSLSLYPLPIPGLKEESIATSGNATASGTALPDTLKQTTTSDRAAFTPQAPTLDNSPAFSGFNPSFGTNPADLLSDQVNLTYQIFNLRMLLERSLSDRLLEDGQPRRQAVLGFNVTIDPPRTSNDAVAVVEITLNLDARERCITADDCLSLVSLMPQEKTYNAAALSTKSNAFGGAAVVSMFQVGFSERRRGQVFYLYRDNDTISYERMDKENPRQVVFGWMFRPTLGRRSVSPGLRQLFAIVSLPSDEKLAIPSDNKSPETNTADATNLTATVQTFWKKYDSSTMTSFEERDTNRASRFRSGIFFGLTKPEIFEDRYTNRKVYEGIKVRSTEAYQTGLEPVLTGVSWRLVGQKSVLITGKGNNFFSETKISLGDKTYAGPSDGLVLKSNQSFDLATNLDALANGPGAVIGRYGSAVALVSKDIPSLLPQGININSAVLSPSSAGIRRLSIQLQNRVLTYDPGNPSKALFMRPSELSWGQPVITINGSVVPPPYEFYENNLQANVPDSLLKNGGGLLKVSYPFLPERWTSTYPISDPAADFQITRLGSKTILIHTSNFLGFTKDPDSPNLQPQSKKFCWQLIASDGKPIPLKTEYCQDEHSQPPNSAPQPPSKKSKGKKARDTKTKTLKTEVVEANSEPLSSHAELVTLSEIPDRVALMAPNGAVYLVDVPKSTQPADAGPKPIQLNQYDSLWIDVAVKDVSKVVSVEANQLMLKYRIPPPDDDGNPPKSIKVEITRDLTAQPGDVEITVLDKDGKSVASSRLHISAVRGKGEKQ
jgi:hypothetical protein